DRADAGGSRRVDGAGEGREVERGRLRPGRLPHRAEDDRPEAGVLGELHLRRRVGPLGCILERPDGEFRTAAAAAAGEEQGGEREEEQKARSPHVSITAAWLRSDKCRRSIS